VKVSEVKQLVGEFEDCGGSVVVSCCCQKLVTVAGDSSRTQSKGNGRWLKAVTRKRLMKTQQTEKT
jgi:hypothetical protein